MSLLATAIVCASLSGCQEPYRVGEYVWVEWDESRLYPAFILEQRGKTRYRVHFDGYDSRCDETVEVARIRGRVEGHVVHPPAPSKGPCAQQLAPQTSASGSGSAVPVSPYQVGDRLRVRWRESVYSATVVGVVSADEVLVHYDGHENAWDEAVHLERIVGRR